MFFDVYANSIYCGVLQVTETTTGAKMHTLHTATGKIVCHFTRNLKVAAYRKLRLIRIK